MRKVVLFAVVVAVVTAIPLVVLAHEVAHVGATGGGPLDHQRIVAVNHHGPSGTHGAFPPIQICAHGAVSVIVSLDTTGSPFDVNVGHDNIGFMSPIGRVRFAGGHRAASFTWVGTFRNGTHTITVRWSSTTSKPVSFQAASFVVLYHKGSC